MKYINGIPRIIYVENGIEKSSIDENKRMNEIDELNRRLFNRNEDETKEIERIADSIIKASEEDIER